MSNSCVVKNVSLPSTVKMTKQLEICKTFSLYIFIAIAESCLLEFPSKHLVEDAVQLSKHLQNRGRPTERTWTKYKEAKAARKQLKGL